MAAFSISSFRSALAGGVHANLFKFSLTFEDTISAVTDADANFVTNFSALGKSGAIPAMTLGIIEVPFRGRRAKIPGDRSFGEWTATFINTADQKFRAGFEAWATYIASNNYDETDGVISEKSDTDYKCTIQIDQLGDDGEALRTYKLISAFPTEISAIDLSYDTVDAIEEFSVTFQYSYFELE
jgi:hypothetical protein